MPVAYPYPMGQSQASLGIARWPLEGNVTLTREDGAGGGMFPMKKSMEMVGDPEFQFQGTLHEWDRNFVIHWMSGVRRKVRSRYTTLSNSEVIRCNISISISAATVWKRPTWFLVGKEEKKDLKWCIRRGKLRRRRLRNQNWRDVRNRDTVLGSFWLSERVLTSAKFCLHLWGEEGSGCLMPFWSFHIRIRSTFLRHSS